MQNAKDTFYEMLRGRLTALNPGRTMVLRGITRPGVLVQENELETAFHLSDCFRLHWTDAAIDAHGAMPLVSMQCAIEYETAGCAANGGTDRGRALSAMDGELFAALNAWPQSVPKNNYTGLIAGEPVVAMGTNIWWAEPVFGKIETKQDGTARTVTVAVMSYQEAGEL